MEAQTQGQAHAQPPASEEHVKTETEAQAQSQFQTQTLPPDNPAPFIPMLPDLMPPVDLEAMGSGGSQAIPPLPPLAPSHSGEDSSFSSLPNLTSPMGDESQTMDFTPMHVSSFGPSLFRPQQHRNLSLGSSSAPPPERADDDFAFMILFD